MREKGLGAGTPDSWGVGGEVHSGLTSGKGDSKEGQGQQAQLLLSAVWHQLAA